MSAAPRLAAGQLVRLTRGGDSFQGVVTLASPEGTAVMVDLGTVTPLRAVGGGALLTRFLALTVDYGAETVTDLWGGEWEVDIAGVLDV